MERLVHTRLQWYLEYNILPSLQTVFRPQCSTRDQILCLEHEIRNSLRSSKFCIVLYLDLNLHQSINHSINITPIVVDKRSRYTADLLQHNHTMQHTQRCILATEQAGNKEQDLISLYSHKYCIVIL